MLLERSPSKFPAGLLRRAPARPLVLGVGLGHSVLHVIRCLNQSHRANGGASPGCSRGQGACTGRARQPGRHTTAPCRAADACPAQHWGAQPRERRPAQRGARGGAGGGGPRPAGRTGAGSQPALPLSPPPLLHPRDGAGGIWAWTVGHGAALCAAGHRHPPQVPRRGLLLSTAPLPGRAPCPAPALPTRPLATPPMAPPRPAG